MPKDEAPKEEPAQEEAPKMEAPKCNGSAVGAKTEEEMWKKMYEKTQEDVAANLASSENKR